MEPPDGKETMFNEASQVKALTQINVQDFLSAWGLGRVKVGRKLLERLSTPAARRFAREVTAYDQRVGAEGLQAGAAWTAKRFAERLEVVGQEHVPAAGPALILGNHPGLIDTVALFASVPRADLRIIAGDRPFLRALPHISQRLIFVPEHAEGRMAAVREATRHLRQGGAILTLPAGHIEPDPAVLPGAIESLQAWSDSIALFAKLVPQTRIVPVIVTGVLTRAALGNPLTRIRKTRQDREWLAATLQLLLQPRWRAYRPTCVRVIFGPPLLAADLDRSDKAAIMQAVTDRVKRLIEGL
jgi:1-acyl-sn-glycerol-3-phosphate acyltransferase